MAHIRLFKIVSKPLPIHK